MNVVKSYKKLSSEQQDHGSFIYRSLWIQVWSNHYSGGLRWNHNMGVKDIHGNSESKLF